MRVKTTWPTAGRVSLGLKKILAEPLFWDLLSLVLLQVLAFIGLLEWIRP